MTAPSFADVGRRERINERIRFDGVEAINHSRRDGDTIE
jgi:hypothetical protein